MPNLTGPSLAQVIFKNESDQTQSVLCQENDNEQHLGNLQAAGNERMVENETRAPQTRLRRAAVLGQMCGGLEAELRKGHRPAQASRSA